MWSSCSPSSRRSHRPPSSELTTRSVSTKSQVGSGPTAPWKCHCEMLLNQNEKRKIEALV
ncbi:hypothetical protein T01_10418 [Trichinella spiralis]|uniref:Uncharacterized protein n=1 Tax=Trichinella spiralis TaxID=6334 RepID=A0A0V0YWK0_TRISP|nr:hypothetical protein T01_10418 [Trichinella spiralis]